MRGQVGLQWLSFVRYWHLYNVGTAGKLSGFRGVRAILLPDKRVIFRIFRKFIGNNTPCDSSISFYF